MLTISNRLCDFRAMQEETNAHLFWECFYVQEYWSNLEIDLTYHRIRFGILDTNTIKTPMINFIILIAKLLDICIKVKTNN